MPSTRTVPLRHVLTVGATAAALALLGLAPGSQAAAPGPPAVHGGLVQAWQATRYHAPRRAVVPTQRLYFNGTSGDQATKLAGSPTATLTRTPPTGTSPVVQLTSPAAGGSGANAPGNAFWTGAFTGRIDGKISISWYWETLNAASTLGGGNVVIHVFADPGTPGQKEIGTGSATVATVGNTPALVTSEVTVKGRVLKSLQISAQPRYADASEDLRAYYGSTTAPGHIDIPLKASGPPPVPRNPSVRDSDPLVLAATRIGRKAAEPTIGLTRQGNAFVAAATFDGVTSPAAPRTLIYGSYDGDKTWRDVSPSLAGQSFPPATLDPYIYVDRSTGRIYSDDLAVACSVLIWSDDQGKTWSQGNPQACESPVDDHQTIVAGRPTPGVTTRGYPNVIYYCVNKVADAQCASSLDGGVTFGPTGQPAFAGVQQPGDGSPNSGPIAVCGGLHGHIVTDPAGRLFLPKGHCSQPWLAISEDGGATWHQTLVNPMTVAGTQTAVASDAAGNIYYVWWAEATGLPYMAVSRDHGRTFGPALLVAPPGVQTVNFPSIDATDPGHVVLTYPGSTSPLASAARPWNYYVAVTTNALDDTPVFHSATANPVSEPVHRGPCLGRCAGMYDFLDAKIAADGAAWGTEVQTCTSAACRAASGPGLSPAEAAGDAQGVVVRELKGPGLRRRR